MTMRLRICLLLLSYTLGACSSTPAVAPTILPSSAVTERSILLPPTATLPGPTMTRAPTLTPLPIEATRFARMPTPFVGPTITASGALLGIDPQDINRLFATLPTTLGDFSVTQKPDPTRRTPSTIVVTDRNGNRYFIAIFVEDSAHRAYLEYQYRLRLMRNRQTIPIGDEAAVDAKNIQSDGVALLHYRNTFVSIDIAPVKFQGFYVAPTALPAGLTNEQLIAILTDVYEKILKDRVK